MDRRRTRRARFKGKFGGPAEGDFYERPLTYLQRVLAHDSTTEDIVIPYRFLIDLYVNTTRLVPADPASKVMNRRCGCGCGSAAWGRNRYAARSCQERGPQTEPAVGSAAEVTADAPYGRFCAETLSGIEQEVSEKSLQASNDLRRERMSCPETLGIHDPTCEECGEPFSASVTGRPRRFCGERCQKRAARHREKPPQTADEARL